MDVAASEFYKDGKYDLDFKNPNSNPDEWLSSDKLGDLYKEFIADAPVVSIEDPFDQDDWEGWTAMTGSTDIQVMHFLYFLSITTSVFLLNDLGLWPKSGLNQLGIDFIWWLIKLLHTSMIGKK